MRFSRLSSKESINRVSLQLLSLGNGLSQDLYPIEDIGDLLPGAVMVQDFSNPGLAYMNNWGCEKLYHSLEELNAMGVEYYEKFFPKEESEVFLPALLDYCQRQDSTILHQFYQNVRTGPDLEPGAYLTSCKLLPQKIPGVESMKLVVVSNPVSGLGITSNKISKIVREDMYATRNYPRFLQLTKREKEIISLLAEGRSSTEIADMLFVSTHTVTTHRKNIASKLDIKSFAELIKFANAFDLLKY